MRSTENRMTPSMMSPPLLISSIITHAARHHGNTEIVSRRTEGDLHRYNYRECEQRTKKLAKALSSLGTSLGTPIGTLAWNGYRHLEIYYAVSGTGAVTHTINPRLFPEQIAYVIDHAEDHAVFFDLSFLPLIERIAPLCPSVKHWVVLTSRSHMPSSALELLCYEELLAAQDDAFEWPTFDEQTPSGLCYTSGTTGNPKGVLYTHRSTMLHCYASALPDALGCSSQDVIAPVVPMFHVNAWGLPYSAPLAGAKLVLPGPKLDGASLYELFEQEGVTYSAGVPTIWLGLLQYVQDRKLAFSTFRRTVIGGSAAPAAMIRTLLGMGVEVVHGWGMTEMSPLGTISRLSAKHLELPMDQQLRVLEKQGRAVYGVDMKIVDDGGNELPWDGKAFGDLHVRGPWIANCYYKSESSPLIDGWFPTGDVATIDANGYMQITDRSKDVIKSGGEWISSIEIENMAASHPAVLMAACIGVHHPKWDERPLLVAVKKPGFEVTREELLGHFEGKIPKWWIPDDVAFVEDIVLTATGKVQKMTLRDRFKDFRLEVAAD